MKPLVGSYDPQNHPETKFDLFEILEKNAKNTIFLDFFEHRDVPDVRIPIILSKVFKKINSSHNFEKNITLEYLHQTQSLGSA